MNSPFLERLKKGPMVSDGAMGTMLYNRGISYELCFDELNLSNPELVQEIHRSYLNSGAELIETNTFGANAIKLAAHGFENKVRNINFRGVKIAREASEILGLPAFVAGAIGPLGKPVAPIGQVTEAEARTAFQEQIEALLEAGVDLFVLETFSSLREIRLAIDTVRKVCDLPIIAQMSFLDDGLTSMGRTPEEVAQALYDSGVDVLGTNCSIGPQATYEVLQRMATVSKLPISVQPNAGLPGYVNGRFMYLSSPQYMGAFVPRFLAAGATLIGGCCGTTPAHIRAMAANLGTPNTEAATSSHDLITVMEREEPTHEVGATPTTLAEKLGKKFIVSVELDPPKGMNTTKIMQGATMLKEIGVDCVNIADSPMARVRMSCMSLAFKVLTELNLESIIHFTTRDRNLMALQSELIGAHALGIRNVLALTGDPPRVGDYPNATAVYDVDSIGLISILRRMNEGHDWLGNSIGQNANFTIACALNPNADDLDTEIERFKKKVDSGAHFVMTQPVYDRGILERTLERVGGCNLPILLGILPLQSSKHCEFLHNEVPGITIPDPIRKRMADAGERGRDEGVAMAREFLHECKDLVAGTYLMPSFGRFEQCAEVIKGLSD